MGANEPQGGVIFDPRGMIGRNSKYTSSSFCGFRDEELSPWQTLTPPGRGQFGPQGHAEGDY